MSKNSFLTQLTGFNAYFCRALLYGTCIYLSSHLLVYTPFMTSTCAMTCIFRIMFTFGDYYSVHWYKFSRNRKALRYKIWMGYGHTSYKFYIIIMYKYTLGKKEVDLIQEGSSSEAERGPGNEVSLNHFLPWVNNLYSLFQ